MYHQHTDEQVMELVIRRDPSAFEEIYDRYAKKMLNYFFRMLWKDKLKAEDFTQEIFAKICQNPDSYNPQKPFKTWFYSVANNMCKNEYKKQEIRSIANNELRNNSNVSAEESGMVSKIDMKVFNKQLDKEVENLNEQHKTTFVLRYRQEMSIKEISEVMDCSEGTVKSRIFYTLKKLGEKLKEFHPQFTS